MTVTLAQFSTGSSVISCSWSAEQDTSQAEALGESKDGGIRGHFIIYNLCQTEQAIEDLGRANERGQPSAPTRLQSHHSH